MLKIAAAGRHVAALGETPDDLRARLQARGISVRRVNRFIELALLGAVQCRDDHGAAIAADAALYMAADTPMLAGCVNALHATLAEQRPPTPFEFMNISGNMAGFYIAQQLTIGGPQLALARRGSGLEAALELLHLQSHSHRRALLGCVDAGVWPLAEQRQRLGLDADAALFETSHWFYVDVDCTAPRVLIETPRRYGSLDALRAMLADVAESTWLALHPSLDAGALGLTTATRVDAIGQGATAEALHRYCESESQAPWLHLSRDESGVWHVLAARKPV
ncbi:MAG: hypothetical protein QM661_09235 [Solimonas sp.]